MNGLSVDMLITEMGIREKYEQMESNSDHFSGYVAKQQDKLGKKILSKKDFTLW